MPRALPLRFRRGTRRSSLSFASVAGPMSLECDSRPTSGSGSRCRNSGSTPCGASDRRMWASTETISRSQVSSGSRPRYFSIFARICAPPICARSRSFVASFVACAQTRTYGAGCLNGGTGSRR
eukprot:Amastigsp_a176730_141.p2 type:complete len:124 gc:universal Amastigsp_a176730_141:1377-1006(-)